MNGAFNYAILAHAGPSSQIVHLSKFSRPQLSYERSNSIIIASSPSAAISISPEIASEGTFSLHYFQFPQLLHYHVLDRIASDVLFTKTRHLILQTDLPADLQTALKLVRKKTTPQRLGTLVFFHIFDLTCGTRPKHKYSRTSNIDNRG